MAESKTKVTKGLAYHVVTGEPVYVQTIETDLAGTDVATVTRGIIKQDGLFYQAEKFPLHELETAYTRSKREANRQVDIENIVMDLREKSDAKRYSLNKEQEQALEAAIGGKGVLKALN